MIGDSTRKVKSVCWRLREGSPQRLTEQPTCSDIDTGAGQYSDTSSLRCVVTVLSTTDEPFSFIFSHLKSLFFNTAAFTPQFNLRAMASKLGIAYGRRLVPQVVDELAATAPDRVYAAIPKTSDVQDGYRDVTMAELSGCVNFMARWLEQRFGKSETFETITYVGLSDLKGITILLAAIKVGFKVRLLTRRKR